MALVGAVLESVFLYQLQTSTMVHLRVTRLLGLYRRDEAGHLLWVDVHLHGNHVDSTHLFPAHRGDPHCRMNV